MVKTMSDAMARRRLMEAKSKLLRVMVNNNKLSTGATMDKCVKMVKDLQTLIDKLK